MEHDNVTDLIARMLTCATYITSQDAVPQAYRDACSLLIEAAAALERLAPEARAISLAEPVERISDSPSPSGVWMNGTDVLPAARPASPRACPKCGSHAPKKAMRDSTYVTLQCPVCGEQWRFRPLA